MKATVTSKPPLDGQRGVGEAATKHPARATTLGSNKDLWAIGYRLPGCHSPRQEASAYCSNPMYLPTTYVVLPLRPCCNHFSQSVL